MRDEKMRAPSVFENHSQIQIQNPAIPNRKLVVQTRNPEHKAGIRFSVINIETDALPVISGYRVFP